MESDVTVVVWGGSDWTVDICGCPGRKVMEYEKCVTV